MIKSIPQYNENDINNHFTLSKDDYLSMEVGNLIQKPNEMVYLCKFDLGQIPSEKIYHSWLLTRYNCKNSLILPLLGYIQSKPEQIILSSLTKSFPPSENVYQNESEIKFWEKYHFTKEEIIKSIFGLTKGIQFLHSRGIYGIDLSPKGIEIDENKEIHIGINRLKAIEDNDYLLRFYAPETLKAIQSHKPNETYKNKIVDEYELKAKTDIYQYGMIIYSLLTGKLPFSNKSNEQIIEDFLNYKKMKIEESDKQYFPDYLLSLVEECLNVNPYMRPSANDIMFKFERRFIDFEQIGIDIDDSNTGIPQYLKNNLIYVLRKEKITSFKEIFRCVLKEILMQKLLFIKL